MNGFAEKIFGIVMIIVGITMTIVSIVTETYLWIGFWVIVAILGGILFTAMSSFEKINDSKLNFIESTENAFNTGKTVVGINTINSTSVSMSKDNGFNLINNINGQKIIAGNGHSFFLSDCTIQ